MSDMERWLRERRVTEVECLVADLNGIARGKILPTDKFIRSHREDTLRLPEMIFVQTVTGDYPDDDRVTDPAVRDVRMRPDPRSLRIVPWYEEPTAQVISDCSPSRRERGGDRAPAGPAPDPRCLRRARLAPGGGARARVLPDQDQRGSRLSAGAADRPLAAARIGAPELRHRCGQRVRPDLRGRLRLVRGAGDRHRHPDPRDRAPRRWRSTSTTATRWSSPTRRSCSSARCARPRSSTASTPPSWPSRWQREPGSAMHVHQSVFDIASRREPVRRAGRRPHRAVPAGTSAGCRSTCRRRCRCSRPNVNSYRRLRRYSDAPINLHWGWENRTVGLRVPISTRRRAPGREPGRRRRRQPLPRDRRLARLRLARHDRRARADQADRGQRLSPGPDPAAAI